MRRDAVWKRAGVGACAGLLAGAVMTTVMLLLAQIGVFYGIVSPRRRLFSSIVFVFLPLAAVAAALCPVLGTHYGGLPLRTAREDRPSRDALDLGTLESRLAA